MSSRGTFTYIGAVLMMGLGLAFLIPPLFFNETVTANSNAQGELPPVELPSLGNINRDFTAVFDRPVFLESRRMPLVADAVKVNETAVTNSANLPFSVIGIIIGEGKELVVFQHNGKQEPVTLPVGHSIDGWTIESVDKNFVVIKTGNLSRTLHLVDDKETALPKRRLPRNQKNEK